MCSFGIKFDQKPIRVPSAFWKKPTLRACKILYSFSANPVKNENPKTQTRIGMYKKMNRVIEKEKGGSLVRVGIHLFLATNNETLCQPHMHRIYIRRN
jgi:hypothetical protein